MKINKRIIFTVGFLAFAGVQGSKANEQESIIKEASLMANSGSTSFSEMARDYNARIALFVAIPRREMTDYQKKVLMLNWLKHSEVEIIKQTGGWGITHRFLMSEVSSVRADVQIGRFDSAAKKVNTLATNVLSWF